MKVQEVKHAISVAVLALASCGWYATAQAECITTGDGLSCDLYTARVEQIGIDPRFEGPMVKLVDEGANPAWTIPRQFYLSSTLGNAGLATLLTAISLGQTVFVRIADPVATEQSLVSIIFLNAPTT